jgi:hypothetical protein
MLASLLAPLLFQAASITGELAAGARLSSAQAAAIEAAAAANKAPLAERARLLGWYNSHPGAHRERRAGLIRRSDSAEAYAEIKAALLARAEKTKLPADRSNAAWFVFPDEPDVAISLTAENGLLRDTAVLAARFLLGTTNPDARSTDFGRSLLQLVSETSDPLFQYAFGDTLRSLGARLYAEGKTEWNYTTLANESLARAAKAEPQQPNCGFDSAALPARNSATPERSPPEVSGKGAVTFYALIGCSGYAVSLEWLDGPADAVAQAKREIAARQFNAGSPARQSLKLVAAGGARKAR